jgi:hypothetical protein
MTEELMRGERPRLDLSLLPPAPAADGIRPQRRLVLATGPRHPTFYDGMFKRISRMVAVAFVALLGSDAVAAGDQCTVATQGNSPVAEACRHGGRAEAKKVMKAAVRAAKEKGGKFDCDDCHKNIENGDFQLKPNAQENFKKLLELAGTPQSTPPGHK